MRACLPKHDCWMALYCLYVCPRINWTMRLSFDHGIESYGGHLILVFILKTQHYSISQESYKLYSVMIHCDLVLVKFAIFFSIACTWYALDIFPVLAALSRWIWVKITWIHHEFSMNQNERKQKTVSIFDRQMLCMWRTCVIDVFRDQIYQYLKHEALPQHFVASIHASWAIWMNEPFVFCLRNLIRIYLR